VSFYFIVFKTNLKIISSFMLSLTKTTQENYERPSVLTLFVKHNALVIDA